MKKLLIIALLAVFATITASAQTAENVINTWQKTITVPASQAPIIEKLFTAWSKEFPCVYVEAYNKFKKTGKADNIKFDEDGWTVDFSIDIAPKNGYLEILAEVQMSNTLTAVYWNMQNGNKLFAISVYECSECGTCEETDYTSCDFALAFYEYNATKGTMTPRPEISDKILMQTDFVRLPKEGRDLEYWDEEANDYKVIKWNGNGF